MKAFDLSELKKTARVKQLQANRSYSEIHKSPIKSPVPDSNTFESCILSRWGKSIEQKQDAVVSPWTNVGQGIFAAAIGEEHVLILNNKNECFGVGNNTYGQLANEAETVSRPSPILSFKDMKIIAVCCGAYHSFLQNSKGEIFAFGLNMKGQLGIGSNDNKRKPVLVYSLLPGGVKNPKSNFFLETSEYKKKLRKSNDQNNELADLTNLLKEEQDEEGKTTVFHLQYDEAVTRIACGPLHTIVLTNKSRIFTCGYGEKWNLGTGRNKTVNEFTEVRVKVNGKIDRIEAGMTSVGYLSAGRAYVVGTIGEKVYQLFTPVALNEDIFQMKLCERSAVVLTKKGQVFQLGESFRENGERVFSDVPRKVQKLQNIRQLFGGANQLFALSENRVLYGWGDNVYNQITGVPDAKQIPTPKGLKIPVCLTESISIISGNATTFLLSSQPLQCTQKEGNTLVEQQLLSTPADKQKTKNSTQKYTPSNLGVEEKQMLNELGIQPRMFNCNMEIDFEQLVFESQISEGGYGIIYKGLWRQTTVAIKMFKIESENAVKDFFSECAAMQALRHPNIVMFLGACTKSPNFAIVLQYCAHGSLWSTIQNTDFSLSWQDRRRFALDTARGVNYLHTCDPPVIHRDLKSLNLLLDDSYRVKLADFGWTKGLDNYMTGKIGTYQWMAPEVIASQKYSEKADVFSYGIILWEIASREPPFKHLSGLQVSLEVLNNDMRPPVPKKTPEPYARLMKRCWDRDPAKRPSFKEIIKELQNLKL